MEHIHTIERRRLARAHERRDALQQERDRLRLEFESLIFERRAMIASLQRRSERSHAARRQKHKLG